MKNNVWTILCKELKRFFGDRRLFFTTVILPGVMIYVLYTFMGKGLMRELGTDEHYVADAYVRNLPGELTAAFDSLSAEWKAAGAGDEERIFQEIRGKEADLYVVFPEHFTERVEAYQTESGEAAPNVEIYYNSTESESEKLYRQVAAVLEAYEASIANKLDINAGDKSYDCATQRDTTGMLFAMLLPMLLMVFLYSGCVSLAPEAIAGEKERGTIATLLVTPMKRSSLALGKIISLSIIALLSGTSSFLGTFLSLPNVMGGEMAGVDSSVYGITEFWMLLCVIFVTALLLVAGVSVLSALAKSVKEAGTLVSPLMLVVMFISLSPMLGLNGGSQWYWYLIPLYNSVHCMEGIFSFSCEPVQVLVTMGANLAYAGLLTGVLTRLFGSERVMFAR